MKFAYSYKTTEGKRLEDEISASSREEVFSTLRERGIRPIKVWEKEGPKEKRVRRRLAVACVLLVGALVGGLAYWSGRRAADVGDIVVPTPAGPVTSSVATPLARQAIQGDRARLAELPTNLFAHVAERYLAQFAEPGRMPAGKLKLDNGKVEQLFRECLSQPIRFSSNEFSEYIDLKRMVVGMKRELQSYLQDGGTVQEYLAELIKRQKMEASYRDKAERRLAEMLGKREEREVGSGKRDEKDRGLHSNIQTANPPAPPLTQSSNHPIPQSSNLSEAYAYWLKANAQLKSMGIYELPLPEELRSYQMSLDLDQ